MQKLFGSHPWRTIVKLVLTSIIVGIVLAAFNLNPRDLFDKLKALLEKIWHMGFDALSWGLDYFLLGAALVLPIWLVLRLLQPGEKKDDPS